MAWVYILRGASGRHYFGSTTDLARRLEEHRRGHTHTTRRLGGELEIVASLELATLREARTLERELKRKKNPQLALGLMQRRGGVISRCVSLPDADLACARMPGHRSLASSGRLPSCKGLQFSEARMNYLAHRLLLLLTQFG